MKKFNFYHWYRNHLGNGVYNYYYRVYGYIFLVLNLIMIALIGSLDLHKGHTSPNWFIVFFFITGIFGGIYFSYILTEKICGNFSGDKYPQVVPFYFFCSFLFSYPFSIFILYLVFRLFRSHG
jgi:hypothetical protein